jgi:hypothetical protein
MGRVEQNLQFNMKKWCNHSSHLPRIYSVPSLELLAHLIFTANF